MSESRKTHGSTAVSPSNVVLFNVIFEEGLVIFVKSEGKRCVRLANFMNLERKKQSSEVEKPCYFDFME